MNTEKLKIGDKIDMLTIVSFEQKKQNGHSYILWHCVCECGCTRELRTNVIRMQRRSLLSCGCATEKQYNNDLPRGQKTADPTSYEIYLRCLEIRESWTDEERERRFLRKAEEWTVPICRKGVTHGPSTDFS